MDSHIEDFHFLVHGHVGRTPATSANAGSVPAFQSPPAARHGTPESLLAKIDVTTIIVIAAVAFIIAGLLAQRGFSARMRQFFNRRCMGRAWRPISRREEGRDSWLS
ncbi:MAG: hypothetical protein IPL39_18040 [Opitutaceae bacterium]|nr:hypothetical protein [Opitutaceae bacterium]